MALALVACGGRTSELGDGGTSSSAGGSGGGGGNGSGGGFPYSGPSCSSTTIPPACWSCIENSCSSLASCVTGACSSYFSCYCACAEGDNACAQSCTTAMSPACEACAATSGQCSIGSCQAACSSAIMSGGSGGTGTSSGAGSSSSGGTSTETDCTASHMACSNGQTVQLCVTLTNAVCTGAYYVVIAGDGDGGTEQFSCTSCTDTANCQAMVTAACQ